jgi:acyl carrier protein
MERAEILLLLDGLLEEQPGTLRGDERLTDVAAWSSLTALGFLVMADDKFGVVPSPDGLAAAHTVNDLIALLGPKIRQAA